MFGGFRKAYHVQSAVWLSVIVLIFEFRSQWGKTGLLKNS